MLILASKSLRRKELLESKNIDFLIKTKETDEIFNKDLTIEEAILDIAYQKVMPIFLENPNDIVIGADTIVVCGNEILGKPKDYNDAYRMLKMLSGSIHYVMTGVIIKSKDKEIKFTEKTYVYFKELKDQEIINYIETENVYDKAGSYAIQEGAGSFVLKTEGDYDNIVGLPVNKVVEYLKEFEQKKK